MANLLGKTIVGGVIGYLGYKAFKSPLNGLSKGKKPSDFNQKSLNKGTKVEMEHTSSKAVAQRIAMDHLTEDPKYYDKLAKMEKVNG